MITLLSGYSGGCSSSRVDLVFVVDSSGSIRDNNPKDGSYDNWDTLLDFVASLVNSLSVSTSATQVGMVEYSERAINVFYMNSYYDKNQIMSAIRSTTYMGSFTNTSGGIKTARFEQFITSRGFRSDAKQIMIVFTDGESNLDQDRTIPDAEAARQSGIEIISVGVTNAVKISEVQGISSSPQLENTNWFAADDFNTLNTVKEGLLSQATDCTTQTMGKLQ